MPLPLVTQFLKEPKWSRQHYWRRAVWQSFNRVGLTGLHTLPMRKSWVDLHRRDMHLAGLPNTLHGLRVVHLSDLHYSPVVSRDYLTRYVGWVNEQSPDVVVITGDLITGGYRFASRIATVLKDIRARHGVICTFGNHDYSMFGRALPKEAARRGDYLERSLEGEGLIVLRNESHAVSAPDGSGRLVFVGLDDAWTERSDPERAFADVSAADAVVCLNHNPADVRQLLSYPWQWMLSGHTHGRAIGKPGVTKRLYGKKFRHYTLGYYDVEGRHLYVNRGLSYGQRARHWCRPEVTIFRTMPVVVGGATDGGHL
jgi:predicted MPP superfamily phosphohydrolase